MPINVSQLNLSQLDQSFQRTPEPIPAKDKVLTYFKSFTHPIAVAGMALYDPMTRKYLEDSVEAYEHDGFYWTNQDVLLFEKYDLQLDPAFINFVLNE
jgi:hypothetical protein